MAIRYTCLSARRQTPQKAAAAVAKHLTKGAGQQQATLTSCILHSWQQKQQLLLLLQLRACLYIYQVLHTS
jgi:hypothetical protein